MIGRVVSHYRVLARIATGGMGEIYRARDTRLDRTVALKFLAPELTRDRDAKARFLREARAASALDHPQICTIHEIAETADGRPFLVMACYEGDSLRDRLDRGPLAAAPAVAIAAQIARGLQNAHDHGVVHRDIKPANVLLTTDGLVKIVDFGLAGLADATRITRSGAVMGTLPYMSPEQVRGDDADGRADLWSLGVMLFEMIAGRHPFRGQRPQALAQAILHGSPRSLADCGVAAPPELQRTIDRCLCREPAARYQDAVELLADLQIVETLLNPDAVTTVTAVDLSTRLSGCPYPGLAAFTAAEASFFFGREREVEELWRRLAGRRLLAVIGPSGVGKTSFLRAGLMPSRPDDWAAVHSTPGGAPFRALRQALLTELVGDADAMSELLREDEDDATVAMVRRWRQRRGRTLIVLDQFEELFTLNPPEVQTSFADLLGRLADETDTRILLGMRDDFLVRCHELASLRPIFEDLTVLGPLRGEELRRALHQPARRCGYGIEDASLLEEMLATVAEERSALPLLAFTMSRLWDRRDRERRLLTRDAYEGVGGVEGALAQHAEEVLAGIGTARQGIVRELFRNLVTAPGTRAVMDREALLSLFPSADAAESAEVLDRLIAARLLVSYEEPQDDGIARQRVEIVHESLLSAWPRLRRWRTQDAESVQLRDQLRQAAQLWHDKGRTDDLLWTGTAYREFLLWRERYPGGLTRLEEEFARRMSASARRRRRRRRLGVGVVVVLALAVAAVTSGLWRRSESSRRSAEASRLLALGRLQLDEQPTAAVAYALASLELADDPTARRFAIEALGRGPTALRLRGTKQPGCLDFSPDGRWLAAGRRQGGGIELWSRDGAGPRLLQGHRSYVQRVRFGPDSELLVSSGDDRTVRVWSMASGRILRRLPVEGPTHFRICPGRREVILVTRDGEHSVVRSWSLDGGEARVLGRRALGSCVAVDPAGRWLVWSEGRRLRRLPLARLEDARPSSLGSHEEEIVDLAFHPRGDRVAARDRGGEIRLWSLDADADGPLRVLQGRSGAAIALRFDRAGERLASASVRQTVRIWNLAAPPAAEPIILRPGDVIQATGLAFHPDSRWIATADAAGAALWPIARDYPRIFRGHRSKVTGLALAPDGSWAASSSWDAQVRLWPLTAAGGPPRTIALPNVIYKLSVGSRGRQLIGGTDDGTTLLIPVDGTAIRELPGFSGQVWAVALDGAGARAAAGGGQSNRADGVVRVWDLASGEVEVLDPGDETWVSQLHFAPDGSLVMGSGRGLGRWDVATGNCEVLRRLDTMYTLFAGDGAGRRLVSAGVDLDAMTSTEVLLQDLGGGAARRLPAHGDRVGALALDPTGEIVVSGDADGTLRVGLATGEEPHLLLGHEGWIWEVAVTPDGQWIVSAGNDGTVRVWPMPDVTAPPLHALPYDSLLARLGKLTNYRVVRDPAAADGRTMELVSFPGWTELPNW
ncbi:protein kinase [bacterium]|nr:protein kinase [bacterium]